jgi:hypothetical protein
MMNNQLPNMNAAVMAWARETRVFVTAKRTYDYKVEESYFEKTVKLFRVPTGQSLEMKPEGQRKWNTELLYTDNDLDLKVDDIIIFDCKESEKFRVMNKTDWNQFGYIEYRITSTYL